MSDALLRRCAGLFMVGFGGEAMDDGVRSLTDLGVFGAILFKRNIGSAAQVSDLARALKAHAGRPFALAVDQEGGRVARLRGAPFTALPTMRALGKTGDPAVLERAGRLLAKEVRAVGFDWDFAPVLDVDTNPKNPVIGDRAFSTDAGEVARLGVALSKGMEAAGVASCAKHFPGHGDTAKDSHVDLPTLPHDLKRLRSVELVPFEAYAKAKLASVMTAHVIFEALEKGLPATMSKKVLDGLLRKELGFEGVLVSDDLEMKAIAQHYTVEEAVVQGTLAGVDLFLVCHHADVQRRAIDALVTAVKTGRVPESRLDEAHARLDILRSRFVQPWQDRLATLTEPSHLELAKGLEASSKRKSKDPTERAV